MLSLNLCWLSHYMHVEMFVSELLSCFTNIWCSPYPAAYAIFERRGQHALCLSVFEWNLHSLNCGGSCLEASLMYQHQSSDSNCHEHSLNCT